MSKWLIALILGGLLIGVKPQTAIALTYQEVVDSSVIEATPEALVTADVLYEEWLTSQQLIKKAEKLSGTYQGSCVPAAKKFLGVEGVWGYGGKLLPTTSKEPVVGAVLKTPGHASVVIAVESDKIYVYESNYNYRGIARTKWIDKDDPKIIGYSIIN